MLEVDEAEDQVQLTTFKAGLRSKEFVMALAKSPPASMTDLLMKAQKYMNAEEALAIIELSGPRTPRWAPETTRKGKKEKEETLFPATTKASGGTAKLTKW